MAAARAHQLDSLRLEGDVSNALLIHLSRSLRRYPAITRRYRSEFALAIRSVLFFFTVFKDRPTPAQQCMNLRYRARLSMLQKLVLYTFTIVFPWAYSSAASRYRHGYRYSERVKAVYLLFRAVHSLIFVQNARYRSMSERAAGTQISYSHGDSSSIPLELLNRTYIWHGLANTAVAISPVFHSLRMHVPAFLNISNNSSNSPPKPNCPICRLENLTMPHVAQPCGCHFCYTCVASEKQARGNGLKCARCNVAISHIERLTAS